MIPALALKLKVEDESALAANKMKRMLHYPIVLQDMFIITYGR